MKIKPDNNVDIVILAAGQGKRMHSAKHKVLHTIANKPMLTWVLDSCKQLDANKQLHIVYGFKGDQIMQECKDYSGFETEIFWAEQQQQLGTAHAVQQSFANLFDSCGNNSVTLVCYADVPLVQTQTLQKLINKAQVGSLAILTIDLKDPSGYGRIVRDNNNDICAIVECKDANPQQQQITEINTGIIAVPTIILKTLLPQIGNNNKQGEYYLTDIVKLARAENIAIKSVNPEYAWEVAGVNNQLQRANLEKKWQRFRAEQLLTMGLAINDIDRFDLRGNLNFGNDCFIDNNVIIAGDVSLGSNVTIGVNCILKDCTIGDNCSIEPFSSIDKSVIEQDVVVGPYARLRPMTHLLKGSKVGNFVEVKKATLGENSKVNHLSYIGDAEIGKQTNIGAGTITCNYDGINKHKTKIGDKSFVGSNTALVAPIELGDNVLIGAGSTISKSIADNTLALTRADLKAIKQKNKTKQ